MIVSRFLDRCSTVSTGCSFTVLVLRPLLIVAILSQFVTMTSSAPSTQHQCPRQCTCRDVGPSAESGNDPTTSVGMLMVDCRARSVSSMADVRAQLPVDVGELDLGQNEGGVNGSAAREWFPPLARLRRLRLDGCAIRRVEARAFRNIRSAIELIDLSRNAIESIDRNSFRDLLELRVLRLDDNLLGVGQGGLPDYAFRSLSLDVLDLSSNGVVWLTDSLFDGVTKIVELRLNDNAMITLNGSCLRPLQQSLRTLSIANNRRPLTVTVNALDSFSLSSLDFRQSGLTSVQFLENVVGVESLHIGGNPLRNGTVDIRWKSALGNCRSAGLNDIGLQMITTNLLSMFPSVIEFDLSNNQLSGFSADVFRGLVPELRLLDLSNSSVTKPSTLSRLVSLLPRLESLNLSANGLVDLDSPSAENSGKLRVLDISNNRLQVIPSAYQSVFDRLDVLRVSGNPIHCNCESLWLKQWIVARQRRPHQQQQPVSNPESGSDDLNALRCASPELETGNAASPQHSNPQLVLGRPDSSFVCRPPVIVAQSANVAVAENAALVLTCSGEADPPPSVHWFLPNGESLGVTPPSDRGQTRVQAIWSTRRVRRKDSGWHVCNVTSKPTNSGGNGASTTGYTYVHVIASDEGLPVNLAQLRYPDVPILAAKTTAISDAAVLTSLAAGNSIITDKDDVRWSSGIMLMTSLPVRSNKTSLTTVTSSGSHERDEIDGISISNGDSGASVDVTTRPVAEAEVGTAVSFPPADDEDRDKFRILALTIGIGVGLLVIVVVVLIAVLCIRCQLKNSPHHQRSRHGYRNRPATINPMDKYSSKDVDVAPPMTSSASSRSEGGRPPVGMGGGFFMPGISLAPSASNGDASASSYSHPLRMDSRDFDDDDGSAEVHAGSQSTFRGRSAHSRRPVDYGSQSGTSNGGGTECEGLLNGDRRNFGGASSSASTSPSV